jgi:hypothetical protein
MKYRLFFTDAPRELDAFLRTDFNIWYNETALYPGRSAFADEDHPVPINCVRLDEEQAMIVRLRFGNIRLHKI